MAQADTREELVIDGSILEGGGQILRNTIALSAILTRPVKIHKIRGGRKDPGLKPQHLTGLQLVDALCGGRGLSGAEKGSTSISFRPNVITGGQYVGDTRTAGSICLLAQVAVPVALFADRPSRLVLRGGTDVDWAPTIDFLTQIFAPAAKKFGVEIDVTVVRRGFFPKGGGEVEIVVHPVSQLRPVDLRECGPITKIQGNVYFANQNPAVGATIRDSAIATLRRYLSPEIPVSFNIVEEQSPQRTRAYGLIVLAETQSGNLIGGTSYNKKVSTPESIGEEAADEAITQHRHGGSVVEYLSDQLIIFMALANGRSTIRTGSLTLHTKTAIHICQEILGVKFDVTAVNNPAGDAVGHEISCVGVGFSNNRLAKR